MSTTTANITFTIPAIAYTPEEYSIEYIGLELQDEVAYSDINVGESDIGATDQVYTITLTGLEEDNTYNFSLVSTNCKGITKTPIGSFTTNPAGTVYVLVVKFCN